MFHKKCNKKILDLESTVKNQEAIFQVQNQDLKTEIAKLESLVNKICLRVKPTDTHIIDVFSDYSGNYEPEIDLPTITISIAVKKLRLKYPGVHPIEHLSSQVEKIKNNILVEPEISVEPIEGKGNIVTIEARFRGAFGNCVSFFEQTILDNLYGVIYNIESRNVKKRHLEYYIKESLFIDDRD